MNCKIIPRTRIVFEYHSNNQCSAFNLKQSNACPSTCVLSCRVSSFCLKYDYRNRKYLPYFLNCCEAFTWISLKSNVHKNISKKFYNFIFINHRSRLTIHLYHAINPLHWIIWTVSKTFCRVCRSISFGLLLIQCIVILLLPFCCTPVHSELFSLDISEDSVQARI